ncbi:unnamed protein product, partial [Lymnaea stagnalis]
IIVNPIIGVTGLVGNILSAVVLVKSGLDKSSHILLLALAVADSFCLMGSINIPNLITLFPIHRPNIGYFVWEFSREISFMLYVLTITFQACYFFGVQVSAAICTLITVERLLAVFYPLHFKTIVTTTRIWMAAIFAFVFWIPYVVYISSLFNFIFMFLEPLGMVVGIVNFTITDAFVFIEAMLATPFGKYIPLAVVSCGSILIAVRVAVTRRKRKQMMSSTLKSSTKSSRTTVTLLTVCAVFSLTKIVSFLTYIIDYSDASFDAQMIRIIFGMVVTTTDYINSSCNFVIYVALNTKFRAQLKKIFLFRHS